MSRRAPTKAAPAPSRARADSLLRSGQILEALEVSKEIFARAPNEENLEHRKQIIASAIDALLDAKKPIADVLAEADKILPNDPSWARIRAGWLARMGKLDEALARIAPLNNPADAVYLTQLVVDQAVRQKSPALLPAEHHAGLTAVLSAFHHYEAGHDEAAREALQSIGLQSPFLDWKVLLRGLIASANDDHARAIENWDRLDANRLAIRLAAPLRAGIDPAFREGLPELRREELRKRAERLNEGNVLQSLREVRKNLGRDGSLSSAFRDASTIAQTFKRIAPDLFHRLADIFYHAIAHHGRPEDLARFRTTFGPPVDDPMFDRLEAMIYESERAHDEAHKHWKSYARWLATPPAGWSKELADRACSIVWFRMATNAHVVEGVMDNELFDMFEALLGRGNKKPKKQALEPDTYTCLKRAVELAPNWSEPTLRMTQELFSKRKFAEAQDVAQEYLARNPNDLEILREIAAQLTTNHSYAIAVSYWERALALQPLDDQLKLSRNFTMLADLRQQLATADPLTLREELRAKSSLLESTHQADILPMEATLTLKAGQKGEFEAIVDRILASPPQRLAGPYRLMVDATLAKLKPAQKTQATKRYKEAIALAPTPDEVFELLLSFRRYKTGGFEYHGIKTHLKQILALVPRCTQGDVQALECDLLAQQIEAGAFWKELGNHARTCQQKFSIHASFVYYEALSMFHQKKRDYSIEQKLKKAKKLAEPLSPEIKKLLMGKIEALLKEVQGPPLPNFGPGFFGPNFNDLNFDFDEDDDD